MNSSISDFAEQQIAMRIGLMVNATPQTDNDGEFLDIALAEAHPSGSFVVRFRLGWRSAEAVFVPDTFAAPLIQQMGNTSAEGRKTFNAFAASFAARRMRLTFRINGADIQPGTDAIWTKQWASFDLSVRKTPVVVNPNDIAQMHSLISEMVIPFWGMLIALIGVSEEESGTVNSLEGSPVQSIVTRYERKQINREACIELKGTVCVVCGFDFAARYGSLGAGYIEVHHTTPVSSMGPDYAIDVATELEPLCANCHAMAHRTNPPIPIARLQSIVAENGRK